MTTEISLGVALLIAMVGFAVGVALGTSTTNGSWVDAAENGCRRCVRGRLFHVYDDKDARQRSHILRMLARDRDA
jgi:hypothetical protein